MKSQSRFCLVLAALTLSGFAVADSAIESSGSQARALYQALGQAGVSTEGAAGKHFRFASQMECIQHGNATGLLSWACEFSSLNEEGISQNSSVGGKPARRIFELLQAAGLESDCGAGKCGVTAETVKCAKLIEEMPVTYRCEIDSL